MKVKVLILEDSELDAELSIRQLRKTDLDISAKVVETKEDFESTVVDWNPDVILSDYNLKTFSGDQALIYAKKVAPEIPIIMLSGFMSREVEIDLLEKHANDIVTKDNLQRLPFAVQRALSERSDKQKLNKTLYELAGSLKFQEALAEISLNFNSLHTLESKLNDTLEIIGKTANVSRVYIFENFNEGQNLKNTYEWCAEGVEPHIEHLQNLSYKDNPEWRELILNEGRIYSEDLSNIPSHMRAMLEEQHIKSLIVYPIYIGDYYFGFVGFDEINETRKWTESEDKLLKSVSGIISNAYSEYQADVELKKSNEILGQLLNEKEILIKEVHHRVKNNMAVISSFLQLDMLRTSNPEISKVLETNVTRISSIAIIQELIYQSNSLTQVDIEANLNKLFVMISQVGRIHDSNFRFKENSAQVTLNVNQAVPFSLLLSELLLTAFKINQNNEDFVKDIDISYYYDGKKVTVEVVNPNIIEAICVAPNEIDHTEITHVLSRQLDAEVEANSEENLLRISFERLDKKGSSSAL